MPVKQKFNFRLSDEAKKLLELMSKKIGITQTSVLELAIREKAAQLNVTLPTTQETPAHENHPNRNHQS